MKRKLKYLFYMGLLSCATAEEKPNILFFLVDDMGTQDTSEPFYYKKGKSVVTKLNKTFRTPNMEKLADKGRLFTNAYAYSVCSPTRVTLLTGQAAPRHRVTTWTHPKSSEIDTGKIQTSKLIGPSWNMKGVPAKAPLLTTALKQAGYTTLFAGKAHFGPDDSKNGDPRNLDFDVNIGGFGGGGPGGYHGEKNYSAAWRGGGHQWDIPHLEKYHGTKTFLTEALTLEMGNAIEKAVKAKKPFFAYMSHYAVHCPFEVDSRFKGNYPQLNGNSLAFATLVEGMDKSLGDLVAKLEKLGVAEDTLIVFYSDNGSDSPLGSAPLRGKKGTRFEGGLKVPLIVAWAKPDPNNKFQKRLAIPLNSVEHDLVTCDDMMPTLLSIAGAKVPSNAKLDGKDITPYFKGEEGTHRPQKFLCHFPHGQHNNNLFTSYQEGGWKVIYNYKNESWQLYNLAKDISEENNLVSKNPSKALELTKKMLAELKRQDAQFPIDRKSKTPVLPKLEALEAKVKAQGALTTDTFAPKLGAYKPENRFEDPEWFNWGGSMIKGDDEKYYLFYSRWPRKHTFLAWLTHSEVAVATSDNSTGPWEYKYTALKGRGGKHWDAIMAHNPKVKKIGENYYLYYISTKGDYSDKELKETAKIGYRHKNWSKLRNAQRTGVVHAKSLNGPWKRMSQPLLEPSKPLYTITVNPAVTQMPNGEILMMLKGDQRPRPGSRRIQAIAIAKTPLGPFKVQPKPAISNYDTEDASIWYDKTRKRYYAIFHAHHYYGLITSTDGINWSKAKQYTVSGKKLAKANGGNFTAERMERPNVLTDENGVPQVFITSCKNGNDTQIFTIPIEKK